MMGTLSFFSLAVYCWLVALWHSGMGKGLGLANREDLTELLNKRKLTLTDYVNRKHLLRPVRSTMHPMKFI